MSNSPKISYPDFIKALPMADLPNPEVKPYLLTSPHAQVVFFDLPAGLGVPPHSHGAQWGIVVDGEISLTIDGNNQTYRRGDSYYIPEGAVHTAVAQKDSLVVDVFAEADRYKEK